METQHTPFYEYHKSNGTIAEFAGFKMPMWYRGAVEEHLSVRHTCGLFDVSHMGRITVVGEEAQEFLDYVLTINCTSAKPLQARHAFLCTSNGGILDDIMLFKLDETRFLLIVNASNSDKDLQWLTKHASAFQAHITDITNAVPMIAIQGPTAISTLQTLTQIELAKLNRLHAKWIQLMHASLLLSRTGYTGEDGFELFMFPNGGDTGYPVQLWHQILESGHPFGIEPCG
ncbi:MAG: glycine cleavage system aminomethyltransferase GcvT, partial [Candidatus Hermodarchaeia archaeon]